MNKIKFIAFDADDTLWVNEPRYQETEKKYKALLKDYCFDKSIIAKELFATEMKNLPLFGYGAKGFTLSMIENAIKVSGNKVSTEIISQIIELGKSLINTEVELLDGVVEVLKELSSKYTLIVATKGDLLDQQRKLSKSGLEKYFDHIEIMSNKKVEDYKKLLHKLNIEPESFLMIGNSIKSDILPVIELGAKAICVPFEIVWLHETVDESKLDQNSYHTVTEIKQVLDLVG